MSKKMTDEEFVALFQMYKSPTKMSRELGITERNVYARRNRIEEKYKIKLDSERFQRAPTAEKPMRFDLGIRNGTVIVFSDAHFWPGIRTTAYNGLIWAIQNLDNVNTIINNGDAFDGASISRFPRIGWDSTPSVIGELKACEMALGEIETTRPR